MKKLLLTSMLSVIFFGSTFGQIRWQTNTTIGQELKAINIADKDTLILDFKNTVDFNSVSKWFKAKAAANLGKDSVVKKTLQTQRGIQCKGFINNTTTSAYENGTFKCNNAGSNGNPGRVASVDSLKAYLTHSVITGTINGSTSDSLTRPAACLFNVGTDEIAFGMWPGKVKVIEYVYRFDYTGKACPDDIQFEINTYDAGTTGKTATYQMSVYKSSTFSVANQVGNTVNVYNTGQGLKTVHVAQEIGVTPADLSNKSLYIVVRTIGTSNALGEFDGLPNPVDANNIPTAYDPTIVFDNFWMTYSASSWSYPVGVVANAVINHDNGSPILTTSTDYSGGTPVTIPGGSDQPVKMYFTSKDRLSTIAITEANDGGGHAAGFSFAETGAIKKNDGSGNYNIDVAYTRAIDELTGKYSVTVPAPTAGSVNDDLEITILGNVIVGSTRAIRLELTNGIRFWYNVAVTADTWTANNIIDLDKPQIWSAQSSIFVANTTEDIQIFNVAGQKVKVTTAKEAERGISVKSGIYVIKTGATVQKVIVE